MLVRSNKNEYNLLGRGVILDIPPLFYFLGEEEMSNDELTERLEEILSNPQSFLEKFILLTQEASHNRRYISALEHDVKALTDLSTMRQNEISGLQVMLGERDAEIGRLKKRIEELEDALSDGFLP